MKYWDLFDWIMANLFTLLAFIIVYLIVFSGKHLINEAECLQRGYPAVHTTWNFKGYCVNIEGAVTGVVEEI